MIPIENRTIIKEVIAIYRWGQMSQKKLITMHNTVYSTVYWNGSKESKEAHYNA